MAFRLTPTLLLPAVLGAAAAAYLVFDPSSSAAPPPDATPAQAAAAGPAAAPSAATALPPNHPAIAGGGMGGTGGHGGHGGAGGAGALTNADNDQPPSITWSVPSAWTPQPNPNAMRLATYKVGDTAQMGVTRAGGTLDANVQRWEEQFEGSPKAERTVEQIHGLPVTIVRIRGTFLGGGMGATAPEKHDRWEMLTAVVESQGTPYFFKLVGAADQVDPARAAFDGLVTSIAPKTSP